MAELTTSPTSQLTKLNDDLLKAEKPDEASKRNTKEWIIERILSVADDNGLELAFSNTKLKRMSKKELNQLLAQLMEQVMKQNMARAVKADGTDDKSIAIGALRMVHDMLAMAAEGGINQVLPSYGYEVSGFSASLQHPTVSKCVDECLVEIAETTDVLEYIESPYARLGLAWAGAMATSIRPYRKIANNQNNVRPSQLGPQQTNRAQTVQPRPRRRPEARKEHSAAGPNSQDVVRV